MSEIFKVFKKLFREFGAGHDLINLYLVFMGVRSACLISERSLPHIFYLIPEEANLVIYFGRYPGYSRKKFDYPLVCLKNSLVSKNIQNHTREFTDNELGIYLGFSCFDQNWSNTRIDRYEISYSIKNSKFYNEVCTVHPDVGTFARIKFRARIMTAALKIIDSDYIVRYKIELIPAIVKKEKIIKA